MSLPFPEAGRVFCQVLVASLPCHVLGHVGFAICFCAVLALLVLRSDFAAFGAFFDQIELLVLASIKATCCGTV